MVTLIIHGPLDEEFLRRNLAQLKARSLNEIDQVVISTYDFSEAKTRTVISEFKDLPIDLVLSKDVANPSFANCNRQAVLTSAGLGKTRNSLAMKLRMDQSVNLHKAVDILKRRVRPLLTTNCYTRVDRWYHPSDMFMMGETAELKNYFVGFSSELTKEQHVFEIIKKVKAKEPQPGLQHWPESQYFLYYLKVKNYVVNKSAEDSFQAIRKFIQIVDSWNLDFIWRKFGGGNLTLLPYHSRPTEFFPFGPIEELKCFSARDFGFPNSLMKTVFYKSWAWIYYEFLIRKSASKDRGEQHELQQP